MPLWVSTDGDGPHGLWPEIRSNWRRSCSENVQFMCRKINKSDHERGQKISVWMALRGRQTRGMDDRQCGIMDVKINKEDCHDLIQCNV